MQKRQPLLVINNQSPTHHTLCMCSCKRGTHCLSSTINELHMTYTKIVVSVLQTRYITTESNIGEVSKCSKFLQLTTPFGSAHAKETTIAYPQQSISNSPHPLGVLVQKRHPLLVLNNQWTSYDIQRDCCQCASDKTYDNQKLSAFLFEMALYLSIHDVLWFSTSFCNYGTNCIHQCVSLYNGTLLIYRWLGPLVQNFFLKWH